MAAQFSCFPKSFEYATILLAFILNIGPNIYVFASKFKQIVYHGSLPTVN